MAQNIENKVIVITGASSGLGKATAEYLSQQGAVVVLGARRTDLLEELKNNIIAQGGRAISLQTDVRNREQVKALVDLAVYTYGKIDVMINNAGIMPISPMSEVRVNEWDEMIDINIKGTLYGVAAALPYFIESQSGHFINLGSVAGIKVFSPGGTVYSGTKYAVRAISDGLRQEVGAQIRVTTIEPGAVESELKLSTKHEESSTNVNEFYKIAIPALTVAKAIAYAIEQPANVDINEIVLRPTAQEF